MPVYLLRGRWLSGQTPCGVFSNYFNSADRWACGGWYLTIHVWRWRLEIHRADRKVQ